MNSSWRWHAGLGLCALAACAPAPAPDSLSPAVLRIPLPRDILTLDPLQADEITTYNVVRQIYEGLLDYDPETLRVVPRVARSFDVSGDGLEWTFELHKGVRFIDDPCFASGRGRDVTARDAKYSIERCLGQFRGNAPRAELPAIAGLSDFLGGSRDRISGIVAQSDDRLVIRLDRPDPMLVHFLVRPCCRLVPREAVDAYGEEMTVHAVGTGPFRLVSWQPLSGILLVRNRDYWQRDESGTALPHLDALRFVPAAHLDHNRLYVQGRIDMTSSYARAATPSDSRADSDSAAPEQRFLVPRLNTIYVRFDYRSSHPLVRDPRLRMAVAYAAQRPGGSMKRSAAGLFPPGLPGFDPDLDGQRTDLNRASALLRAAGHPDGRGLPELRLAWREWDVSYGTSIAASLRRVGLRVRFDVYSDARYQAAIDAGEADVFRAGWVADYPDPQNFLQLFYTGTSPNLGGYSNREFDRLFEAFRVEPQLESRLIRARRLERLLVDDAAAIFLHHEQESQFVSPWVENWRANGTNPLNTVFYERIRLRPPV